MGSITPQKRPRVGSHIAVRGQETDIGRKRRARRINRTLELAYPGAHCELDFTNPLELTVATILSAQCTDVRVNQVTPALFERYPTAADYAHAERTELEEYIRPTGFYRNKATSLMGLGEALISLHDGRVPGTLEELVKLPGVGRKTANVVMCQAFRDPQGIAVDTHVFRIAHQLGFATRNDDTPEKVEAKLMKIYPQSDWLYINHQWVHFGREFCVARRPKCQECFLADICPSSGK